VKKHIDLLVKYDESLVVNHSWGQSPESVYSQVASVWKKAKVGDAIAIVSRKKHGFPRVRDYLVTKNLQPKTVGKGPDGLRIMEVIKSGSHALAIDEALNKVEFEFHGKSFQADVGAALFSRKGLDRGTRHLLDYIIDSRLALNSSCVSDLGAGWGAIGLVLSNFYDDLTIDMYENDAASLSATQTNLGTHQNYRYHLADITSEKALKDLAAKGANDYIVCNPPFHLSKQQRESLFRFANALLKPGGELIFVVEQHFADRFYDSAIKYLKLIKQSEHKNFTVDHFIKDGKLT